MDIPKHYFRTVTTSGSGYSSEPTGNIDVERYISGQTFWVKPEQKKQVPKKLILVPPHLIDIPYEQNEKFEQLYERTVASGFELYKPVLNASGQISYEKIKDFRDYWDFIHEGKRLPKEILDLEAKDVMQTFPFKSPDEFLILDSVEVYKFIHQEQGNEVYISDIKGKDIEAGLKSFKQAGMTVVQDCNYDGNTKLIDKKEIKLIDLNREPSVTDKFSALLTTEKLSPAQRQYIQENLSSVIKISGAFRVVSAEAFQCLAQSCPNLEVLDCAVAYDPLLLPRCNNLIDLYLDADSEALLQLSEEDLKAFLDKFPKLKSLKLAGKHDKCSELQEKIASLNREVVIHRDPLYQSPAFIKKPLPSFDPPAPKYDPRQNINQDIEKTVENPGDVFSQSMINFKLKSYLETYGTPEQQQKFIPRLNSGICAALADLFYASPSPDEWQQFIGAFYKWDLTDPKQIPHQQIASLLQAIEKTYISSESQSFQYLGDGLKTYLSSFKTGEGCILENPFHAISLKKIDEHTWHVYDPNYRSGFKTIKTPPIDGVVGEIHHQIGQIVSVVKGPKSTLKPHEQIQDVTDFLEHGGLDAIIRQPELRAYFFRKIKTLGKLEERAWDGLRFQDTEGVPFWLRALKDNDLNQPINGLLDQYPDKHHFLQQSLDNMEKVLGKSIDLALIRTRDEAQQLISEYCIKLKERGAQRALVDAKKKAIAQQPHKVLAFELTHLDNVEKTLLQANDSRALQGLSYVIQQQARSLQRPVFVVESPNDLQCVKSWISKDASGQGVVSKGLGGPLYLFLETHQDKHPLVIIHYDKFDKEDVIRFNSILDRPSNVDGYPIPPQTQIIALQNPTLPNAYLGEDFKSRFDKKEACVLDSKQLQSHIPQMAFKTSTSSKDQVVNLYNDEANWKKYLLGYWTIQDGKLQYQAGALSAPLADTLIINNGPWQSSEFNEFWEKALFNGFIEHEGEKIALPEGFQIVKQDGYAWQNLSEVIAKPCEDKPLLLNPSTFNEFFQHQHIHQQTLAMMAGHIADYQGKVLPIYVTREITENQWAQLLSKCQESNTTLSITLAPGVNLPEPLRGCTHQIKPLESVNGKLIQTNDVDASIKFQSDAGTLVIDVSELSMADLWSKTESEDGFNTFRQTDGVLKKALDNPQIQDIILTGSLSPQLQDGLASIFMNQPKKNITLCVQDKTSCSYLAAETEEIKSGTKRALIGRTGVGLNLDFEKPLVELQTRAKYARRTGGVDNSDKAWQGIDTLEVPHQFAPLHIASSAQDAQRFQQARLHDIQAILKTEPFVFLTGLSGVGKTTFVQKELSKNATIYNGEHRLKDFVTDDSDEEKILFIDEANLKATDWSIFEGLYQSPPYLIIDGQLYPVSAKHKIVFAGNPCNYGDERKLASFFARHGNCLVFDPLPAANLYEEVLKPCFEDEPGREEISQALIDRYQYLIQFSRNELLVSPRELQMIALLTVAYHQKNPDSDMKQVTEHFAHEILSPLVPPKHQQAYLERFPKPPSLPNMHLDLGEYKITPSREPASQQMMHVLQLREFRQQQGNNPAKQSGGLGGIIIEGEPGIGKSELVIHTLRAMGFREGKVDSQVSDKVFYKIPVSMSTKDKEALLLKAFDEGAVVIVDEINSAPMMERLLNDLLMGKTPDQKPPKKPGFTLIGTQNPVSMGGRQAQSTALSRRLQTIILPDYPKAEKVNILTSIGVGEEVAHQWADEPDTSFRVLIRRAKHLVQSQARPIAAKPVIPHASAFTFFSPPDQQGLDSLKQQCYLLLAQVGQHARAEIITTLQNQIQNTQSFKELEHIKKTLQYYMESVTLEAECRSLLQHIERNGVTGDFIALQRKKIDSCDNNQELAEVKTYLNIVVECNDLLKKIQNRGCTQEVIKEKKIDIHSANSAEELSEIRESLKELDNFMKIKKQCRELLEKFKSCRIGKKDEQMDNFIREYQKKLKDLATSAQAAQLETEMNKIYQGLGNPILTEIAKTVSHYRKEDEKFYTVNMNKKANNIESEAAKLTIQQRSGLMEDENLENTLNGVNQAIGSHRLLGGLIGKPSDAVNRFKQKINALRGENQVSGDESAKPRGKL